MRSRAQIREEARADKRTFFLGAAFFFLVAAFFFLGAAFFFEAAWNSN